ncbi:MAG: Flp pilus assembly complex ATPase component TadA, partial [Candidatus Omnitrophica bacterium]|nr:Flp pilus assembly complex ATPase component TadA [Candidatus Omnitrophota bacterium]
IEAQKKEKGRIGEILVKLSIITEEDMTNALGTQLGIPFYSSDDPELLRPKEDQELEKLVPADFAQKNTVLPLSKTLNSLTCAVSDPLDLLMLDNLRRISGCDVNLVLATRTTLQKAINAFYFSSGKGSGGEKRATLLDAAVESSFEASDDFIAPQTDGGASADLSIDRLMQKASEAPVIKLVDLIIRQAIDERASDIHIEPFDNKLSLRYRIDGALVDIPPPAPHLHMPIVSRIKILAKLDIAEKRLPQDGALSAKLENRKVDIRVSTVPTVWGEKVVMRILDKDAVPLSLTNLGFLPKQVEQLKKALNSPYGMFFVTGPTGSGKSTSLYAAVNETVDPTKNVMTAEDPVEYRLEGINQVSVKSEIGLTFATALKAFLRQDPDIIMVGETRDLETASICVRAALTGHFVLSTLHTNDRLTDIGVPNYLLTPSLIMILAQRLAKRLCPKCKEPYEPDPEKHGGHEFKSDLIYRAKGCHECNNVGYKGRIVVGEVLEVSDEIRLLIGKNASHQELKDCARKQGMLTLFESGLKLVEEGITSYEEVCRVSIE